MITDQESTNQKWHQGVSRYAWLVLAVASLGWVFDSMDQHLYNLVANVSLMELLAKRIPEAQLQSAATAWRGAITAVFLIGWAIGGFFFGILGDKIGRTRTMMITILMYAGFTGLCTFVKSPEQYMALRFLTALGIGGEFAAGVALVAEVWPQRSRPMALGMLQALSAFGNIFAALFVYSVGDSNWRTVYIIGVVPALLVVWIRARVKEPERWQHAKDEAEQSGHVEELGNIKDLFRDPVLRRNTAAGVLLALAGVGVLWGVGFWLKDLLDLVAKSLNYTPQQRSNLGTMAFLSQNIGAFFGIYTYAAFSERVGRRPALFVFFVLAFLAVQATFWLTDTPTEAIVYPAIMGYCAVAPFSAFAIYFPELYPTRLRSTGVGFCYNCARILAAAAPYTLGKLSAVFAGQYGALLGFRMACSVVTCVYIFGFIGLIFAPETRGKPLPE